MNKFFLFIVFCSLFFASSAFAEERIDAFTTHIEIKQNGSAVVQEEIVYNFGEDAVGKHGIYREIPLIYQPIQGGGEARIEISSVSVSDGHGTLRQTASEGNGNTLKLKIGDPDTLVSGPQLYVIHYTVWGAFNQHFANDEFYWNVTGDSWKEPIGRVRAEVVLPAELSQESVSRFCYVGSKGATSSCAYATTTSGVLPGTITMLRFEQSGLAPYEGLTLAVGVPKGTIIFTAPKETGGKRYAADPPLVRWWTKPLINISLALPLIVFAVMFNIWFTRGRDPKGRGTIITEYDVPENLSPLESAGLVRGSITPQAISAAIIDLAERGYLKIERITKKGLIFDSTDYELTKLSDTYGELLPAEQKIMEKLFETDRVFISKLKNKLATVVSDITDAVFQSLTEKGYFVENPQKVRGTYLITGIVLLGIAFFIPFLNLGIFLSGIIIVCFAWLMPKMTVRGAILKERLLGFKSYLSVAEKDRINFANAPEKNPAVFEKFLPYAMIFGVEKAWATQFEGLYMQDDKAGHWYAGSGPINAGLFASEMDSFANTTSHAFTAAGSASGGGGSSGGGAGGGGGGSW